MGWPIAMVGFLATAGPASAMPIFMKYDGIDYDVVSRSDPGTPDAGASNPQARTGVNSVAWHAACA